MWYLLTGLFGAISLAAWCAGIAWAGTGGLMLAMMAWSSGAEEDEIEAARNAETAEYATLPELDTVFPLGD